MPIKPIDIITMAPKSQEVSQFKHQESQKTINEQLQISSQFNSKIQHNNRQPVKTQKSENEDYRYDAKEKGNNSYTGTGSKKKEKEQKKSSVLKDEFHSGSIDIKI